MYVLLEKEDFRCYLRLTEGNESVLSWGTITLKCSQDKEEQIFHLFTRGSRENLVDAKIFTSLRVSEMRKMCIWIAILLVTLCGVIIIHPDGMEQRGEEAFLFRETNEEGIWAIQLIMQVWCFVFLHNLARISLGSRAQQQKSFRYERWPCDHLSRPAICIARTHAIAQRAQISLLQVSCRGDSSESFWKLDFSSTHSHYKFIVKERLG